MQGRRVAKANPGFPTRLGWRASPELPEPAHSHAETAAATDRTQPCSGLPFVPRVTRLTLRTAKVKAERLREWLLRIAVWASTINSLLRYRASSSGVAHSRSASSFGIGAVLRISAIPEGSPVLRWCGPAKRSRTGQIRRSLGEPRRPVEGWKAVSRGALSEVTTAAYTGVMKKQAGREGYVR